MSGKNLTFKLILDGDSKGLVTATKQSEDVTKKLFDAIKAESEQIKQATESTSKQIGNIIPKGTTELADKLTQSLTAATEIIQDAGDNAKSTAGNFTDFGNKAEKALGQLKSDLAEAKKNLEAFSKTSASPVDIEVAKRQVDKLEKEVQQADEAFSNFHGEVGRANTKLQETDSVAKSTQKGLNTAKFAVNALAGAMATLGVGLGIRELAETADTYTNLSARINIATKEGGDFTSAMAGVHQVALMTNSSLDATASLFTRLNTVGKEMGMTQQQVLDLTKTVTQAIQVGGGSAQASEAAIQQFIQAMQGGVLRGEEFNSIMENGYGVAEALARGLGVTTGELRKMAENGELSSERVVKALQSQAGQVQATYDQFPTTIGNALQRISTSWNIVIGNMDQANGASATVAQWLVTLADNMGSVETLLNDIGKGFVWVGDQLKKIDPATIDAFKTALSTAYDTTKSLVISLGSVFESTAIVLDTALSAIFDFNSGIDSAEDKTNGLTKLLQTSSIVFALFSDGFKGIAIVVNLFAGAMYEATGAFMYWKSKFMLGDAKAAAFKEFQDLTDQAKLLYKHADELALDHEVQVIKSLENIGKTREQKSQEAKALSKSQLDQLLSDQQAEVNSKKVSEESKLKAVLSYAEAAIVANGGVMDGTMQADMMTKGYIVTMDAVGKVSVNAWDVAATGADKASGSADRARKAAVALQLDLDVALNKVSDKFTANQKNLNDFALGLEKLGIKGQQAADVTYQAWAKWLETAKSQAEIDLATSKLQEFGKKGQLSVKQVELGLQEVRRAVLQLPGDIDPVEQAFERLGIKTKEQLKLVAKSALADFNTIQSSGQATAESLRQAYERTMQAAVASGDQAVISATQAKATSLGLQVQISETGSVSVSSMNSLEDSIHRVRSASSSAEGGFRSLGRTARDEADSVKTAWDEAMSSMHETVKGSRAKMASTTEDIEAQLKAMGYSDERAKQLAKSTYEGSKNALGTGYKQMGNNWSFVGGGGGMSNVDYVNSELQRLQQYVPSSTKAALSSVSESEVKNVNYSINFGGQTLKLSGTADQESTMNQLIKQLQGQAKST